MLISYPCINQLLKIYLLAVQVRSPNFHIAAGRPGVRAGPDRIRHGQSGQGAGLPRRSWRLGSVIDSADGWSHHGGHFLFFIAKQRAVSFIGAEMKLPTSRKIDRRLVIGSALFGIGWGIAGFCPGPGLVSLGMGQPKALVFVIAMVAGMALFEAIEWRRNADRVL